MIQCEISKTDGNSTVGIFFDEVQHTYTFSYRYSKESDWEEYFTTRDSSVVLDGSDSSGKVEFYNVSPKGEKLSTVRINISSNLKTTGNGSYFVPTELNPEYPIFELENCSGSHEISP